MENNQFTNIFKKLVKRILKCFSVKLIENKNTFLKNKPFSSKKVDPCAAKNVALQQVVGQKLVHASIQEDILDLQTLPITNYFNKS